MQSNVPVYVHGVTFLSVTNHWEEAYPHIHLQDFAPITSEVHKDYTGKIVNIIFISVLLYHL